jgi:hypothetical protein
VGRELKRVPLDFSWPINEIWTGYLNPFEPIECPYCKGSGLNPATKEISDLWYDHDGFGTRWGYHYNVGRDGKPTKRPPWKIWGECRAWQHNITQDEVEALFEGGRLMDFTHVPRTEEQRRIAAEKRAAGGNGWLSESNGYVPTADEINEWSHHGMGHDSINHWICVKARAKRLGIYGQCERCRGEGQLWATPEIKAAHEAWTEQEPPTGDGYQLWQTTSEGSPISPVFPTLDALCEWAEDNATTHGEETATTAEWRQMLDDGLVCHKEGNNIFL